MIDEQPAYLPKFFAVYNKRGATPVTYEARKACLHQAFRASFTLAASLYIRARDPQFCRDLALRQRVAAVQAVPQGQDAPLAGREAGRQTAIHGLIPVAHFDQMQPLVLDADRVQQSECAAVPVAVRGFIQRYIILTLASGAEMHQDLIFDTPCGVGCQTDALVGLVGADGFDEADGADGDEVILVCRIGVVFFDDVRHQAQVVFDQLIPGSAVALRHA